MPSYSAVQMKYTDMSSSMASLNILNESPQRLGQRYRKNQELPLSPSEQLRRGAAGGKSPASNSRLSDRMDSQSVQSPLSKMSYRGHSSSFSSTAFSPCKSCTCQSAACRIPTDYWSLLAITTPIDLLLSCHCPFTVDPPLASPTAPSSRSILSYLVIDINIFLLHDYTGKSMQGLSISLCMYITVTIFCCSSLSLASSPPYVSFWLYPLALVFLHHNFLLCYQITHFLFVECT